MQSKLELAREAIAQKDFKKLDNLWTDIIIDKQVQLNDIIELTNELRKQGALEQALFLLEVIVSQLESENEYRKLIEVYKNMLHYKKEDSTIRKELVILYKKLYENSKYIAEYIEISGLDRTEPIYKSLAKLEEFLCYDIGNFFYFERYGIGEVVDAIPAKKEIVIGFEKKPRHFLTIDVAKGLLLPINKEHFLYKKYENIGELRQRALSNPVELIKFIIKSFDEPLTARQIKTHLEGIIDKNEISKWWEKVRKNLEADTNIKVSGKTIKSYDHIESGLDKNGDAIIAFEKATPKEKYLLAEHHAKKNSIVFKQILPNLAELGNEIYEQEPGLAIDILILCNESKLESSLSYDIDEILSKEKPENIITELNNLEHQKILLRIIREKNPDKWIDIFEKLVFSVVDFKLLEEIVQHLQDVPDKLARIYFAIFSMPRQYPQQFQWLLKKIQNGKLDEYLNPSFIPKFIDSLEYMKGIKALVRKILSPENFDAMLKKAKGEDAKRIIEAINRSRILAAHDRKDFLKIIEHNFQDLFPKDIDIIYATEASRNRKREELDRIYTIDIPENKKEISQAREYGDLSENFEYKAAKERQDQLYQKLKMLEAEIEKARIIEPNGIDIGCVNVGTKITLKNLQNDDLVSYTILGRWDTDLSKNIISNEAPIAKSLLGKVCTDRVSLNSIDYEVMNIEKGI